MQINQCKYHSDRRKDKNHMIVSTDAEAALDKIQHPFTEKPLHKLGSDRDCLNILKVIYEKPTATIILNSERLKAFMEDQE